MPQSNWYIPADSLIYQLIGDDNDQPDFSDNVPKDLKDLRRKLELVQLDDGLSVLAIAVAKDEDLNEHKSIPALSGEPINVNVYDFVKDYYYAHCYSYFDVGPIPVNYKLCIKGVHDWMIDVPLPLSVIQRYMTERQSEDFEKWKKGLGASKDFYIETIQAVNVY